MEKRSSVMIMGPTGGKYPLVQVEGEIGGLDGGTLGTRMWCCYNEGCSV